MSGMDCPVQYTMVQSGTFFSVMAWIHCTTRNTDQTGTSLAFINLGHVSLQVITVVLILTIFKYVNSCTVICAAVFA